MAITCSPGKEQRVPPQRWWVLLLASILLHIVAFNWAEGRLGFPSLDKTSPETITSVMLAPPAKPLPPPKPAALPKPKAKRKHPPAPKPVQEVHPAPVAEAAASQPSAGPENAGGSTEPAVDIADTIASAATEAEEQSATRYKIDPPPSAELQYDVRAAKNGQNWYGSGVFRWQATELGYSLSAEASVTLIFKISVLSSKSEGAINEFGVAPVLYSEKPWRKPMTNTHFRHEERIISFSASEAIYPYSGGEQDRTSVIWQLAGIGRGDASQFAPGAAIDIFVAGTRNAETWNIRVIGEEEVDTPFGKLMAWHAVRAPRADSYDKQIDIWLAPQQEWYPAKVRYTERNGDHIELSLSHIAPAAQ
ncbi:MAG TPA: DUF3108 domain-containing protein [Noviherbaspirillum sp.]|nr:DUF3108 domain-containing protein [Noviherbaspirillum sp.]